MTKKLRIRDMSGGYDDWDIGPEFAREPGESIEDWIDRVQDIVIDTIPDCGGYDDESWSTRVTSPKTSPGPTSRRR